MKHHIRTLACVIALLAAIVAVACGGKQTIASKSAAAFDDAKKKGIPITAGEHGGHSAEGAAGPPAGARTTTDHAAMPGMPAMDHSKMPGMQHGTQASGAHDMAAMDHSAMAGMDHSKMPGMQHATSASGVHKMVGMDHSAMTVMDHSKMPGMQHSPSDSGAHKTAAMDHSAMAGMDHSKMPGMQHAGSSMAGMPAMQHGSRATPMVIAPPASNAAMAQTQPAATLRADEFDAPAPTAIEEAAKAASPKPQPPSEHQHHGGGEAS